MTGPRNGSIGTIYYIVCVETQRCKIGFTSGDPTKRLRALQTGSPSRLVLLAVHPGNMDDERQLHAKFSADCLHGEWFENSEDLILHVASVAWLTVVNAAASGEPAPEWARTGLQAMHDLEPLPEQMAAFL